MAELGLFPLELVLLPTERIPLHVFEPRYKELIRECLDEDREFGLLLTDAHGLRRVGTRAAVAGVLRAFPDGRMDVVVEGRERFRLRELTAGRSFQTAEVEPLEDEPDPPEKKLVARVLALFRRLSELAGAQLEHPDETSGQLSFELAAHVEFGTEPKQELLELRSERDRLLRLEGLLEKAIEVLTIERRLRGRAAGNGRVSPLGD